MTVDEFNRLCRDEWEHGHGDVTTLHLTSQSGEELRQDMILSPGCDFFLFSGIDGICDDDPPLSRISNPITRTPVRIKDGETSRDFFEVMRPVSLAAPYEC